ncbi:zinc ribbon domain-containing protein [Aquilutibacter rugosus]
MAMISCPECSKQISDQAVACPNCGYTLNGAAAQAAVIQQAPATWHPGIAAVLSLVIPGAGQMYKGQVGAGIVWLVAVVIGYFLLVVPGLILHLLCILSAASGKR